MSQEIKFGTDGWRGIIADDFTFENVRRVAGAIASFVLNHEEPGRGVVMGAVVAARLPVDGLQQVGTPDRLADADRLLDDLPTGTRVTVNAPGPPYVLWNRFPLFVLAILLLPRLGTAALIALFVLGQMIASLAFDQFGWFGAPKHPVDALRVLGAVLLVAGVVLIRR